MTSIAAELDDAISEGADGCVAFIRAASTTTVRLSEAAGIPIWLRSRP
jgi:hypothetical protein